MTEPTFIQELTRVLNGHENDSNTPDFILAEFLTKCLDAWNEAVDKRAKWYGRMDVPGRGSVVYPPGLDNISEDL